MIKAACLALCLAATPAPAQTITDCSGWQSSAQNIPEPWSDFSRTFANGEVRATLMDTIEPAAAAYYLMILTPPYDELGSRTCAVVGETGGHGFMRLDFRAMTAAYDPARGLTLFTPIERFDPGTGAPQRGLLAVTINQATGAITAIAE